MGVMHEARVCLLYIEHLEPLPIWIFYICPLFRKSSLLLQKGLDLMRMLYIYKTFIALFYYIDPALGNRIV